MTSTVPKEGRLAHYLDDVWRVPLLSKEDEIILAIRWREQGDLIAAHRLVTSHLRLVVKISMKYRNQGLPVADLISEGSIGLMRAVRRFDPDKGFRLSTYARWWIKAAILDYIQQSWSMIKLGTVAAQKKMFFKLRGLKARLRIIDNDELTKEQAQLLSKSTEVPVDDIIHMNRRLSSRDISLNTPVSHEADADEFVDLLVDDTPSVEDTLIAREEKESQAKVFASAIASLSDRDNHIFCERYLRDERPTLKQLGQHHGISHERVRQLEEQALKHVKMFVANWKLTEVRESI